VNTSSAPARSCRGFRGGQENGEDRGHRRGDLGPRGGVGACWPARAARGARVRGGAAGGRPCLHGRGRGAGPALSGRHGLHRLQRAQLSGLLPAARRARRRDRGELDGLQRVRSGDRLRVQRGKSFQPRGAAGQSGGTSLLGDRGRGLALLAGRHARAGVRREPAHARRFRPSEPAAAELRRSLSAPDGRRHLVDAHRPCARFSGLHAADLLPPARAPRSDEPAGVAHPSRRRAALCRGGHGAPGGGRRRDPSRGAGAVDPPAGSRRRDPRRRRERAIRSGDPGPPQRSGARRAGRSHARRAGGARGHPLPGERRSAS